MQPKLKRKQNSEASMYCSRSQAIKRLALSLPDFRRLCILKGVFPRVPKTTLRGRDKVYYYLKDIRHLAREPILQKFYEEKILTRRLHKALSKRDPVAAGHLDEDRRHVIDLDLSGILLERYPSLLDALRDMDDALSLICLFASCAARNSETIEGAAVAECRSLVDEWLLFVSEVGCLNRCFASIKGIYYEVEILGQKIVWLMPHEFSNAEVGDVDFKVMGTFLLLYRRLVKFVLVKLYQMSGLVYPPTRKADAQLSAGRFLTLQAKLDGEVTTVIDSEDGPSVSFISQSSEAVRRRMLFRTQIFYLSRETPVFHLAFIARACGAQTIGFDDFVTGVSLSPIAVTDNTITHHFVDRPAPAFEKLKEQLPSDLISTRSFVQPQWLLDSVNAGALLPLNPFAVGATCPPHLSPFGDTLGHVPEHQRVIEAWVSSGGDGGDSAPINLGSPDGDDAVTEASAQTSTRQDSESKHEHTTENSAYKDASETRPTPSHVPKTFAEIERAKMLLTSRKRRLYKTLRDKETVRETARERLTLKAQKNKQAD